MADAALHVMPVGRSDRSFRGTLRRWGMTTNTDGVRWSVLAAIMIPLSLALMVTVGSVIYAAATVSANVTMLSKDMDDLKKNVNALAQNNTHLTDDIAHGAVRMDAQDRSLGEINSRLSAMQQQLYELKEQVDQKNAGVRR